MKVTTLKDAVDWFIKNPGRGVTCEHKGRSVNCTSIEEAEKVFEVKETKVKSDAKTESK